MTRLFIEKRQISLASYLTVLEQHRDDGTKYIVVDGNHRLRAVQYIRDHEGKVGRFNTLTCRAYTKLSSAQALSLGFTKNREASDVYKVTDYDIVVNLQKIIQQLKKWEEETIYLTHRRRNRGGGKWELVPPTFQGGSRRGPPPPPTFGLTHISRSRQNPSSFAHTVPRYWLLTNLWGVLRNS